VLVSVGAHDELQRAVGDEVQVDLLVGRPDATGTDVAAISVELSWNPAILTLKSHQNGDWTDPVNGGPAVVVVNDSEEGSLRLAGFAASGTTKPFTLQRLTFLANSTGKTVVDAVVPAAGSTGGDAVAVRARGLRVTVSA
jgi:hypothetical protein